MVAYLPGGRVTEPFSRHKFLNFTGKYLVSCLSVNLTQPFQTRISGAQSEPWRAVRLRRENAGMDFGLSERTGLFSGHPVEVGLTSECPESNRTSFGPFQSDGGLLKEQSEWTSDLFWSGPAPVGLISAHFGLDSEQIAFKRVAGPV